MQARTDVLRRCCGRFVVLPPPTAEPQPGCNCYPALFGSDLGAEAQPENGIADGGFGRSIEAFGVDEERSRDERDDQRHGNCKGTLQAKAAPCWQLTEAAT